MADNTIPLHALVQRQGPTYQEQQAQQFTLQNLQRQGQIQDLNIREAQRQQQDQLKIKQVLGAGLPDDQTIQRLRMSGLPDAAFAYEKGLAERNKSIAEAGAAKLKEHQAAIEETSRTMYGLSQVPEGPARQQAWDQYRQTHPQAADMTPEAPDDATIKMIVAQGTSVLDQIKAQNEKAGEGRAQAEEQRKIAEEQRKIEDAGKPSPLGAQFVSGGQQTQTYIQKNPDVPGGWEIKTQQLGPVEAKPTETAPRTVTTAEGVMQWNPKTNKYDIKVGDRPPSQAAVGASASDPKDIAKAIIEGSQPPVLTGLYRDAAPVRAELARKGFDLATAQRDWTAIQKHLGTLNGAQQERLRQAITFANDTLPQLEDAYKEWKKQMGVSGYKVLNKAALSASKQFPGVPGSAAQQLEALIADYTSELGTVYKGGNSSTDESLALAAKNLSGDWNEQTFNDALKRLKTSIGIRKNSILNSQAVGVSPNSPYNPPAQQTTKDPLGIR